jgi:hypothetical protein
VLARYGHLEAIPDAAGQWDVTVHGGPALASALAERRAEAYLFRDLATLRIDPELLHDVGELRWTGPTAAFDDVAAQLEAPRLAQRAHVLARARG